MKRSEMVELIAKTMEESFDEHNGSWQQDAEKVLGAIEEAGMMPPYSSAGRYKIGRSGETYFSDDKQDGFEWDKE